jgi:FKBP-type peptidyl-prolyl cis-trans isomerase FkpA
MMNKLIRRTVSVLACALPLLAAACDGDVVYPDPPTIEETTFAAGLGVNLAQSTRTSSGLYYRDETAGTGAVAQAGKTAVVHYTLWLPSGQQLDTNVGQSGLPFVVGAGRLVPGFEEGVTGMKVGGTRQLIVPSQLGYGTSGQGSVPGNAILVFRVTLDSVQ